MKRDNKHNIEHLSKLKFVDHITEKNSNKPPLVAGMPRENECSIAEKEHNNERYPKRRVIIK